MRYNVEIDETNTIRIFDTQNPNENGAPFFLQPHHEDGTPFTDRADAEAWAEAFIAFLQARAGWVAPVIDETVSIPSRTTDEETPADPE